MNKLLSASAVLAVLVLIWLSLGGPPEPADPNPAPAGTAPGPLAPDELVNPESLFEPVPVDESRIARGETLLRRLDAQPTSLNPLFYTSRVDNWLIECIFDGPFKVGRNMDWVVNDAMVKEWKKSPDGKVYTITLHDNLRFHDGKPLTAHDIEFTWRTILDDDVPVGTMRNGRNQLEVVEAVDDRTVRYVHKEARPVGQWDMVFPILPKHIIGNPAERAKDKTLKTSPYYQNFAQVMPIGSGPYRMVRWVHGERIELARWEGYYGKKVHFKRMIFKVVKDAAQALNLFKREEIDELMLAPTEFESGTSDADFAQVGVRAYAPTWNYYYVGWNNRKSHAIFSDRRVRQALAHAFDIGKFLQVHCKGLYEPVHGMFAPASWAYDKDIKPFGYDRKRAAELLDEAGWKVSEDDGLRYKTIGGKETRLAFKIEFPTAAKLAPQVARALQEDLKAVGILVETPAVEYMTLRTNLLAGKFDAYIMGWGSGTDPDTSRNIWHSSVIDKPGGRNYVGFANARVDDLFEQGRKEMDPAKRKLIYQEMHRLVYQDQPYLFICTIPTMWAFNKRIRGVYFSPRGIAGYHPGIRDWWVHVDDAK